MTIHTMPTMNKHTCPSCGGEGEYLGTLKVQKEHFGEERYLRIQKMNGLKAGEAK